MDDAERARLVAEIFAESDPKRKAELVAERKARRKTAILAESDLKRKAELIAELIAELKAEIDAEDDSTRKAELIAELKAELNVAIKAESDPKRKAELKKEFFALVNAPLLLHEPINKELHADIRAYIDAPNATHAGHKTYPITPKLAASVARWPKATEDIVVYRGQSKKHLKLPGTEKPFFSATDSLEIARDFGQWPDGNIFKITLKPGVRFLRVLPATSEGEILVAADGVLEYGDKKVRVGDSNRWNMAIPVTIYPKPEGGRRTKRRRTRRQRTRRNV